jgi:3-oxoacid CoA-transferase subunit A
MTKVRPTAADAIADLVSDGMTVAVGGFGLCGNPFDLIEALRDTGARELTIVSNNLGVDGEGLGLLLENNQVRRVIASYVGGNLLFAQRALAGDLEVEFVPQGTLAERLRAGGAGIPAFYTPTGVGTQVADGKPTAVFDGRTCILEQAIIADIALVHAHRADREGNLSYRHTARNFNPLVATAGRMTVAEIEILDTTDYLDPNLIVTPGIYVNRIAPATERTKPIEQRTVNRRQPVAAATGSN